jgi:fatty acid desaturase
VGAAFLCERYFSWPLYLLTGALIGGRLLGLGILMHDAVHGLLHPNKQVNEILGDVLCSWPLWISLRSYRQKHLAHHRWVNTQKDPDYIGKTDSNWNFPMPLGKFARIMLIQLTGLGVFESFRVMSNTTLKEGKEPSPRWYKAVRFGFYFTVIGAFVAAGLWKEMLLYWLVPFFTWTQFANRLRRVAEHSAVEGMEKEFQTRTTIHGWIARLFLAPNNIGYHNEHHLLPGVPWYRLPQTHKAFGQFDDARAHMHTAHSYQNVLKEIIREEGR